ncbi:similar to Saccharomyces cerevisiae YJL013C MAD3 Subunit of the spindle- assembly checkpoint complex, which delays anaphase onset in cells with defects in mitotic spindle assembly [Maudiozyma barnettii]|uniref:Similar to Saccharomyces cerevisiae YJL013C MAD3 Subunit of the spindle- assembly checkpoint complex, which delays anaphase onset in cells with defects in mitotic spindle assembly n=1 Tax=Maudiozyma barnettii TaxID=61262 RepID=A0A8H2ZIS9_9SACH|nr:uncharacterized protein KABA2_06S02046 [Kazachstania barnettii]CAB4255288.1 similar to Saccharomyces cerevisiae YJL013C MAD3 Subunit of the spindle- assembly checkpoint complex, which delays anaphase onset in cells with defects in mitotic spindle assembly [Kazachstania barnettii]CAD1783695.1 similar to Saccharomyces cerevisiae YJL013C MAD3 Subunit of the spindle- assembly checkpoint complex, which delays anaphase onset in cells with defects in mitotic spindle assembly [Kazachstania barnettii]
MLDDQTYSATKVEFEQRLYHDLEELDDPLELFLEYISWLHQYHQDGAELSQLLRRCIDYTSSIDTYSNDPRFLKIWLWYIQSSFAADPMAQLKEFDKMLNYENGLRLALWYEEVAKVLHQLNHLDRCLMVLQHGINNNARPMVRLKRILEEYQSIGATDNTEHELLSLHDCLTVSKDPIYKIIEVDGRKPERIDCNFDLLYTENDEEFNVEQLLAKVRGVYYHNHKQKIDVYQDLTEDLSLPTRSNTKHKIYVDTTEELTPLKVKKMTLTATSMTASTTTNQIVNDQYTNVTSTSLLPLKDDMLEKKPTKKDSVLTPHSPTVTMFSKDAMDDVYSMFNQQGQLTQDDTISNTTTTTTITRNNNNNNTTNRYAVFEGDGFTQDFTRPNIDDLTEVKPKSLLPSFQQSQLDSHDNDIDNVTTEYKSTLQEFMTPIQEHTEHTEHTEQNEFTDIKSTQSSPFLTQPPSTIRTAPSKPLVVEHPLDSSLRNQLLLTIDPPLDQYQTFYRYNQSLRMSTLLKKIHKLSKSENKSPIVDFKKTGDLYCIRSELGQGGYAIVYLAESSTGNLKALKIERPASVWEYYIMKQIETRLSGQQILKSIIHVDSLHYFLDESYLVLNYANQGTVLDLINSVDNDTKTVDELLCMFLTIELMKVIECIHDIGIIHGDLKPDNCMIRFEPILTNLNDNEQERQSSRLGHYNRHSRDGWNHKGIYLIDFGRSFDMSLFPQGTTFKSDWKTDQQDCSQMRLGKEWTFEADYYGLAGIIHSLLFGQFIDTIRLPNNKYKLRKPFKRYWHTEIWEDIFNLLLNSGDNNYGELPVTSKLRTLRQSLENILEQDSNSDKLRRIVLDLETDLMSKDKTNETHINK